MIDRRAVMTRAGLLTAAIAVPVPAGAAARRIDGLIAAMTIEEKAGQLSCFNDDVRPVGAVFNPIVNASSAEAMLAQVRAGRVGMLFNGYGVAGARRLQAAALQSRLMIPLVLAADVIHGCGTIFPIPLAEAAAFDPDLSERAARAVAREATAGGLHWTFAPVVDVARDQRWGRVAEGAGEDVYLNRLLAVARVRGFQGPDLKRADAMLATPKHFVGYSAVRGGMEYAAVDMSEAELRETYLPPFAEAFAAGAGATMASFTDFGGVPVTANRHLLTDVLRGELGFNGVCVSDYDADRELTMHGIAADEADAARLAILAGIDVSMQSGLYNRHLPALVASGAVPIAAVDQAVRRVLALKDALGLFDDPYRSMDPRIERRETRSPAIRRLAREVATRSIVLLKNVRDILPLPRSGKRIALIGPFATDRANLYGPWSFAGEENVGIDLAAGIRTRLGEPASLIVEPGSDIRASLPDGVTRAVAAARAADVVLLAVGEGGDMSGEGNSRVAIDVPAAQRQLAEAVAATGTPVVVLLRHGRALVLEGAIRDAAAIVATWFLGEATGDAVADVIFGIEGPSGHLPVSFPLASGQQPWSYDHRSTGRPASDANPLEDGRARWRDAPDRALYSLGHGLTYGRLALEDVVVAPTMAWNDELSIGGSVHNSGTRDAVALVQLYIHDRVASRTRPVRQLKRFVHVTVRAGDRQRFTMSLTRADLAFVTQDGTTQAEPGDFDLQIALNGPGSGVCFPLYLSGGTL
ncbi:MULTISPECIES: glycoside hydrolase family 3 N-terminal domain-containing protein [unclassified Sphingomonas]|uniref:glycoside hydrolase family 3 N-terminal domain-containing protein n=1 Tax=unclassified Sphingomonas TaxID=196159 RepID=UPI0012E2694D|nr:MULTISPECIES: glycoside hydrolase family 3 N-terminal domain-containing protein [unclassified Sphingomonas]MBD8552648.1 glycoside hydrolase family 3 C-terminal domain-containing protein [Sphingomonas sp. CFBP 8764]